MTVEQFRTFHKARPFEPFVVHVADQRFFGILHPEAAILSRLGRTVAILNMDGRLEVIDMLLVTSIRPFNEMELRVRFPFKR